MELTQKQAASALRISNFYLALPFFRWLPRKFVERERELNFRLREFVRTGVDPAPPPTERCER